MNPQEYFQLATEHVLNCNLCGATKDQWATIAVRDRFGFPVQTQACLVCGMTFISPRLPASVYADFYASGAYRELVYSRVPPKAPLEETQQIYAKHLSDFLNPVFSHWIGSTMLDIGGSTGVTAAQMRESFEFVPTVLELSEAEIARAKERGIETIQGSIDDFQTARKWDIVMVCQSIDHFLNPRAVLNKIRSLIRPGGLLFIDIADVGMQILKHKSVEMSVKLDHPNGFTYSTMWAFLEQTGFVTIHFGVEKKVCKRAFVCRRDLPRPGTLPPQESVTHLFAYCNRVRMGYEAQDAVSAVS